MKKLFFALFIFATAINVTAQTTGGREEVLTYVDQMPSFPGGETAMNDYLKKNIQYPKIEKEFGVSGIVYVTFIVQKDGSITDIKCLRGVKSGPALEKEAVRVIKTMPKWKPGSQNGKIVSVQYQMPVKFILDKKVSDDDMLNISNTHYKKALELANKGQHQAALNELDYCTFFMAGDVNTLYQRGLAFHNLKKDKEACDEWNKIQFQGSKVADEMLSKYCK